MQILFELQSCVISARFPSDTDTQPCCVTAGCMPQTGVRLEHGKAILTFDNLGIFISAKFWRLERKSKDADTGGSEVPANRRGIHRKLRAAVVRNLGRHQSHAQRPQNAVPHLHELDVLCASFEVRPRCRVRHPASLTGKRQSSTRTRSQSWSPRSL